MWSSTSTWSQSTSHDLMTGGVVPGFDLQCQKVKNTKKEQKHTLIESEERVTRTREIVAFPNKIIKKS